MDCITCGCELIGYKVEPYAAICSENHMICKKCNEEHLRICPYCESEALYCNISPNNENSFKLFVDMQRQSPEMLETLQDEIDIETDIIAAEAEVIEEQVLDDEEEDETKLGHENETESSKNIFRCMDSIIVGKKRLEESKQDSEKGDDEESSSYSDATHVSSDSSEDSSEYDDIPVTADLIKALTENPIKPSKLRESLKNKSILSKLRILGINSHPSDPMTSNMFCNDDSASESDNQRKSAPEIDHKSRSKFSTYTCSTYGMDKACSLKCLPRKSFTCQYEGKDESKVFTATEGCEESEESDEDGPSLYLWRAVKKDDYTHYSMFSITASKNDKRMQAVLQKLEEQQMLKLKNATDDTSDSSDSDSNEIDCI